ncbi:carboxypeptidase-like regulatory domain-containing protein [Carboxylicivirga sp. N1Y90]|uniref:carboxypeptidase-like regulatory domain-containing protein n=1 Tax=Carboxylicivirga fragile TaxID=3417571 RepID=UPI003D32FECB|nr:carboxypeptidase-like regulatory domain-containing protein [Marinilabiliaceae bacterium N1Y90]
MLINRVNVLIIGLIFSTFVLSAQKRGVIIDELTQMPIPYVNIQVLGTKDGFNSDEKGIFKVVAKENSVMVFSAVGFEGKELLFDAIKDTIKLKPIIYELDEVNIVSKDDIELSIGKLKRHISGYYIGSFAPSLTMIAYYYPYDSKYNKTPYLKLIKFITFSRVKNATFMIRLFEKGKDGAPGQILNRKPIVGVARKGVHKTEIDIDDLNIPFPKKGLFIAVQWLHIEENMYIKSNDNGISSYSIEPSFAAYKRDYPIEQWTYYGTWSKCRHHNNIQIKIILNN